ncbi:MAG: oligopeptide ABC transporter ATP-binding protein OppF [Spirochaetae bacterium HGW-Spirochaetae-6]|nr:MAG: oligopeptide ABC transporter ATP-binding protein OppF [Spirochaetae bacterium HGW-Spirochaetae-6]
MLDVKNLSVHFGAKTAVRNLSFQIEKGQNLGVIGESGSGKTTLARALMRLVPRDCLGKGSMLLYHGRSLEDMGKEELKMLRRDMQLVFQDPFSSFNPRIKIQEALAEGLVVHGLYSKSERLQRVKAILARVGLSEEAGGKYPHEFSGGQRQRLALARVLVLGPSLIIADEPVSALDVSVQAQILNLMLDLKEKLNLTYILIAHDLGIVDYFCDRILVMYQGELMESGAKNILREPFHPYTKLLLHSRPGGEKYVPERSMGDGFENSACPFYPRCPERSSKCASYNGEYYTLSDGRVTSCVLARGKGGE